MRRCSAKLQWSRVEVADSAQLKVPGGSDGSCVPRAGVCGVDGGDGGARAEGAALLYTPQEILSRCLESLFYVVGGNLVDK